MKSEESEISAASFGDYTAYQSYLSQQVSDFVKLHEWFLGEYSQSLDIKVVLTETMQLEHFKNLVIKKTLLLMEGTKRIKCNYQPMLCN